MYSLFQKIEYAQTTTQASLLWIKWHKKMKNLLKSSKQITKTCPEANAGLLTQKTLSDSPHIPMHTFAYKRHTTSNAQRKMTNALS